MRRTTSFGERGLGRLDPLLFSARSRRLVNQLPPGAMVVADLGCGHEAAFLQRLAADRRLVTGIGLDLAVRDFPASSPIRTVVWDLNRPLPIPSCTVDAAVSLAVLEHLTEPLEFLREVRRILRPGGVLLLTTPTPAARPVLEFVAYRLSLIDAEEIRDHKHYYSGAELLSLAVDAGFDPRTLSCHSFSFGFNQLLRAATIPSGPAPTE